VTDHATYRRHHRVTPITERVVKHRIVGLRRRVLWRMRELGKGMTLLLREDAEREDIEPMRKDSMWHTIGRKRMDVKTFELLTRALMMDEVDGWNRPFPTLPPMRERLSVAQAIAERLRAKVPGKEETNGSD